MMQVLFFQGAGEGAFDEDALLAASLQNALGNAYSVRYPRLHNEASPEYPDWRDQAASEIERLEHDVALVGHSVGASLLLKYLSEGPIERPISGLFLLAAPFWRDEGFWKSDEVQLPTDVGTRLGSIPSIQFYHCRDDEIVPFEHLALYATLFPQAKIWPIASGGHQFGNNLDAVAAEIMKLPASQSRE